MSSFSREILEHVAGSGSQPVLIIDQSTISQFDRHELIMVALRLGKRAIPIAWRVYKASGSLGWREQKEVLDIVKLFLPKGCQPILMGDRFYGNCDVISWCQQEGWDYCLRLKGSMILTPDDQISPVQSRKINQFWAQGKHQFIGALLTRRQVKTNIQMFQSKEAQEPWFIAMSAPPSRAAAQEYAKRWGIECLFSDFKSRGFGLRESQLRVTARLNRLVMVMAIALYWAVSTGLTMMAKEDGKKNE